jgi:hypothetical protein
MSRRSAAQPDLFEAQPDLFATAPAAEAVWRPEDDPEYMASIRRSLYGTVEMLRKATKYPWRNFTDPTVLEITFESKLQRLPAAEAAALGAEFARELDRLYAICELPPLDVTPNVTPPDSRG